MGVGVGVGVCVGRTAERRKLTAAKRGGVSLNAAATRLRKSNRELAPAWCASTFAKQEK